MIYCPKSHSKNLYTIDPFKLKITQHQLTFHSFAPHCPQLEAYHNSFSCFHIIMTFHIFQSEFVHLRYMSLFTQWETFFINSPWFILIRLYLLNSLQLHTAQGYFFVISTLWTSVNGLFTIIYYFTYMHKHHCASDNQVPLHVIVIVQNFVHMHEHHFPSDDCVSFHNIHDCASHAWLFTSLSSLHVNEHTLLMNGHLLSYEILNFTSLHSIEQKLSL